SESERLIRENNYIYDARITVKDSVGKDTVDVIVTVQDVWSISAALGADPVAGTYDFGMKDVNFLGLGQLLDTKLRLDPNLPRGHNYRATYTVNNIYKTYITGQTYYRFERGETSYGLNLNRDFFSPVIKWAGGASANRYESLYYTFNENDSMVSIQPLRFSQTEGWLGHGWNISSGNSEYKNTRLILAGRVVRTQYSQTPVVPDSIPFIFYDNNFYLSSIGVISRRYYKDNYIFRFGRTEDIPEGHQIAFTAGIQDRKITGPRNYFGVNMVYSRYWREYGYIFGRVGVGSFYEENRWKEGVMFTHVLSFSPLINLGKWKWRNFIGLRYVEGINPNPGVLLTINQSDGLRGFRSAVVRGTSKFVVNYESNFFPPFNFIGFRTAAVLFADFAWIGEKENLFSKENCFPGVGVGIRFRNDHLIFNTIQLLLGYYPNTSAIDADTIRLFETGRFYYNFYNVQFSRPATLPYN
ncbi:MAG: hypothetical protein K2X86_18060, partial [Cytophagaceae bacterium]|nr:hypothetical protein [Cytophagaceae bacterium]